MENDTNLNTTDEAETYEGARFTDAKLVRASLYRFEVTYDPLDAKRSGVTEADLATWLEAMIEGWAFNRSSNRTKVDLRHMVVFDAVHQRGAEPAYITDERVQALCDVVQPEKFDDYTIRVNTDRLPAGMTVHHWAGGQTTTTGDVSKKNLDPTYGIPLNTNHRKYIVCFVWVEKSNPNGDPQLSGDPRSDERGFGEISPWATKHVIRNYVERQLGLSVLNSDGGGVSDVTSRQAAFKTAAEAIAGLWDVKIHGGVLPFFKDRARGCLQVSWATSLHVITVDYKKGVRSIGHMRDVKVKPAKVKKEKGQPAEAK